MVYVTLEPQRGHRASVAAVNHQPGQLHLQEESRVKVWENPGVTTCVLELQ